jgi:glycosyltransferase involved in cell wall biosynthesis
MDQGRAGTAGRRSSDWFITSVQSPDSTGRIVHCADYRGPYAGSFIPMLRAAASAARSAGLRTTVCFSEVARGRGWLGEFDELASVRFIERGGMRAQADQLASVIAAGNGHPTVVHTHFGTFDVPAAVVRVKRRNTAVVWHSHSARDYPVRLRGKAYGAVLGRMVNATICVSPEIYADLLARAFPPARLVQMANAIDVERFGPVGVDERAVARRALGIADSDRVVLHFAWNWRIKGGDRLLAVADLLSGEGVRFLTVVGEDAPLELLKGAAGVRPLEPRGDVSSLYAAADVFLNCSRTEGMPYAVLEALSRGLPVVATDLPVQRDVLGGLPGARIVPAQLPGIAAGLRELLAFTPEQRADHAYAARARVIESYALDGWAKRLTELYIRLLGAGTRS